MSQITLYLDDTTQALVDKAALASGVSKSRWVAEAIRHYAADEWPQACRDLAGSFPDFPLVEQGANRANPVNRAQPADTPRITF